MSPYEEPKMVDVSKMLRHRMSTLSVVGQARIVAQHYLKLAGIANHLLSGIKVIDSMGEQPSEEASSYMEYMMDIIKKNHIGDFGIALEWPKEKQQ